MQMIDQLKHKIRGPNLFLMNHTVSIRFLCVEDVLIRFCLCVYLHEFVYTICMQVLLEAKSGQASRTGNTNR